MSGIPQRNWLWNQEIYIFSNGTVPTFFCSLQGQENIFEVVTAILFLFFEYIV